MRQHEPTLDDLLEEPIIRQIMIADGQGPDEIRRLMQKVGGADRKVAGPAMLAAGIVQGRDVPGFCCRARA
jgi:hypothetical protein